MLPEKLFLPIRMRSAESIFKHALRSYTVGVSKKKIRILEEEYNMEKIERAIVKEEGQKKNMGLVSEAILTYLLLSGFILSLKDLSYSISCIIAAFVSGLAVILFFQQMDRYNKVAEKAHAVFYIVCVAFCAIFSVVLIQGFLYMANLFIQLWNLRFGTEGVQLSTGGSVGIGSVLLWLILGAVFGNILLSQIKKRRIGVPVIIIMIAVAFSSILGQSNIWPGMVLLLASLLGLFIFYSVPHRKLGAYGCGCIGAACIFVLILTFFSGGYKKSASIEQYKYNVVKAIERFRYGEDSLPQGNFRKASTLLKGAEERLEVKMDKPQELYLRGYVGSEYKARYWKTLPLEKYSGKYEGMLTWLEKNEFLPATQYASYDKLSKEASGEKENHQNVDVKNKNAYRKYMYLPSALSSWEHGSTKQEKDWNIYSTAFFGVKNYDFTMTQPAPMAETVLADDWTQNPASESQQNYLNTESVYHSFVEDSYLTVSEKQKELIEEVFFAKGKTEKDFTKKDFTEVTTQIRQILRSEMTYRKEPQALPANTDFLQWFLKESKEGNAVAYATAAVMAYRVAGYPARYVEGYHLSADEAKTLADEKEKSVILTTQNAHVWAEVYVTGVGWLPVEVVPGLYTETYTNETVEGRPAYKINPQSPQDNLDTGKEAKGGGTNSGEGKKKQKKKQEKVLSMFVAYLLFIWALGIICYLLLELQRAIRLYIQKNKKQTAISENKLVDYYIKEIGLLLLAGKIKGNFSHPLELWGQIEKKYPDISKAEYEKVLKLVQKARFGGMALKSYEIYTLECFIEHFRETLYNKQNIFGKVKLRYIKSF